MKNINIKIVFICFCFLGYSQNKLPNDWHLEQLEGSPKSFTENTNLTTQNAKFKTVFTYNKEGYLLSKEDYNDYYVDEDSLGLTERTTYTYPARGIKIGVIRSVKNDKNIGTSSYKMIATDTIKVQLNKNDNRTEMTFLLDNKRRIRFIDGYIYSIKLDKELYKYSTEMIYDNNKVTKITVRDGNSGSKGDTVDVVNVSYDDKGNIIHKELRNEEGVIISIVKRSFKYD